MVHSDLLNRVNKLISEREDRLCGVRIDTTDKTLAKIFDEFLKRDIKFSEIFETDKILSKLYKLRDFLYLFFLTKFLNYLINLV